MRLRRTIARLVVIGLIATGAATAAPRPAYAESPPPFVWDGDAGTADRSWHTAANWSTDVVPGASDDATVPAGFDTSTGPQVSTADAAVHSLALSSPLELAAGRTLTLGEGISSFAAGVTGAGTLTNTGTLSLLAGATWSGPTIVNTGTLQGAGAFPGETFGPLVNTGLVRADQTLGIGPISGVGRYETGPASLAFRGAGNVLPSGASLTGSVVANIDGAMDAASGTIALGRDATVFGTLTVHGVASAQTFSVLGQLVLSDAQITGNADLLFGELEGNGTITGLVTSGHSIVTPHGVLVTGRYRGNASEEASTLVIGVTSAGSFDRFVVTGTADVGNVALQVTRDAGYTPAAGDVLRFLQADLGLTGTFTSVTGAAPFDVRYDANGAELFMPVVVPPFVWDGDAGAADRSWHTAANWSTNVVPGASDDATVPTGFDTSTGPQVTTADAAVNSLTLSSPLEIGAGRTLTLGEGISSFAAGVTGAATGTLTTNGLLSLLSGATWSGPTIVNTGTLLGAGADPGETFGPLVNTGLVRADQTLGIGPVSGVGRYESGPASLAFRGAGNVLPSGASLTGSVVANIDGAMDAASGTIALGGKAGIRDTLTIHGAASASSFAPSGAGRLVLDDALITGNVNPLDGELEGNGTITGTVFSHNSVVTPHGVLVASGYSGRGDGFTRHSTLVIGATNAGSFDRLVVTGTAALDDVELEVTRDAGYTPVDTDVLRFLQADGGLTGTFTSVTGAAPFEVRYDANGAELFMPVIVPPFVWDGDAGTADRSWHTAANWSTDAVPGASDDATVPTGFDTSTGPQVSTADAAAHSLALSSPLELGAGRTLTLGDGSSSFAAGLTGTGTLTNNGTLSLLAGAAWSGPTIVNTGTLLGAGASSGATFGPLVNTGVVRADQGLGIGPVSGDGSYQTTLSTLSFRGAGNVLPSGASLSGTHTVYIDGTMDAASGTIALDGGVQVFGSLTVHGAASASQFSVVLAQLVLDDATLTGDVIGFKGHVDGHGTISGQLDIDAGLVTPTGTLTAGSFLGRSTFSNSAAVLAVDVTSAGSFDRLVVTGSATLYGPGIQLQVSRDAGYTPAGTDVLRFLQADGGLTGTFASVTGAAPFDVRYDATGAELYVPDTTGPVIIPTVTPATPASGWHNGTVDVAWTVTEDGPITSTTGCDPTTISSDTPVDGTTLTCTATSAGGTSSQSVTIKRDGTAPTITASVAPPSPDGNNGWYVTRPIASYSCGDELSGLAERCPPKHAFISDDDEQSATGSAVDVAGNVASATVDGIKVDTVAPTVVCPETPNFTVGQTGSVTASVSDAHSGPATDTVSAAANTSTVGSRSVSLTGSDVAGNTTTVSCDYTVSDVSAPTITATVTPETPASGWHTGTVQVVWTVEDPEGPVTSTGCDTTTISSDTPVDGTTLTCTATSAGGTSSQSVTIKRDATAPTITSLVAPPEPDGIGGWYRTAPTVSFTCSDAPSGIASCSGPTTLLSSAIAQSVTGYASDVAGNVASTTVSGLKVDTVAPTLVCDATPTFVVGQTGAMVTATVSDAHSGPAGGNFVQRPANVNQAGTFSIVLSGADRAGNRASISCPYVVQKITTVLDAHPVLMRFTGGFSVEFPLLARLTTAAGSPIANQVVRFNVGGREVCSATTNSRGEASCGLTGFGWLVALLNGGYTAAYGGNATYQPSSDSAGLIG